MSKPKTPEILLVIVGGKDENGSQVYAIINAAKKSAYIITWLGSCGVCNCRGYEFQRTCKHERAVAEHIKINGLPI